MSPNEEQDLKEVPKVKAPKVKTPVVKQPAVSPPAQPPSTLTQVPAAAVVPTEPATAQPQAQVAPVAPVQPAQPQPTQPAVPTTPVVQAPAQVPAKAPKVQLVKKVTKPPTTLAAKDKKKYSQVRYRTRIIKGSILPILYALLSFQMLNKAVFEFPNTFKYEILIIVFGFLLGLGSMAGITISNLIRAKNKPKTGIDLNVYVAIGAFLPFIIVALILAFFISLSTAWQFSMGYFVAAIFPLLIVILYEIASKKKFFIQEVLDTPSEGMKLIATAS